MWLSARKLTRLSGGRKSIYILARRRGWKERRRQGDFLIQWWVTKSELEWLVDRTQPITVMPGVESWPDREVSVTALRPSSRISWHLLDLCREQVELYDFARCARKTVGEDSIQRGRRKNLARIMRIMGMDTPKRFRRDQRKRWSWGFRCDGY